MFFHSITSLIIFLPLIFLSYPLIKNLNKNFSNLYLLIFSFLFYSFDVPWFIIPLLISALSDYFISRRLINDQKISQFNRILLLITSLFINIGLLILFKYQDLIPDFFLFRIDSIVDQKTQQIILPAGISFYTFQTLSFTIDSFKNKISKIPNFLNYLLYVSYFPQLVAGPILRPSEFFNNNFEPLLNDTNHDFINGFSRISFGLFLKLCLADELAIFNDFAFKANYLDLGFLDSWTMAFGFGLQIYYDFSAYSHMAIGVSKIIGLNIKENFVFPYSSTSSTEFWRRWHISLSSWVSDYLYKFLNKRLPIYFYGSIPLLFTWSIMGLWHGSSWRFFIWGLLNGFFIIIHRICKSINFKPLILIIKNKFISWIITIISLMSSWIYFRSANWDQANYLYQNLFMINKLELGLKENYYLFVFVFSIMTFIFGFINNLSSFNTLKNNIYLKTLMTILCLTFSLIFINRQNSFIYFQF